MTEADPVQQVDHLAEDAAALVEIECVALINPTRGAQLWVMFAPLFVPLFAYLLYLRRSRHWSASWAPALLWVGGLVILLWALSWTLGWVAFLKEVRENVGDDFLILVNWGYSVGKHDFAAPFLNGFMYESGWSHQRTEWDDMIRQMRPLRLL